MTAPVGRLKRRREFLQAARTGRKWAAPGLVLQARPNRSASSAEERADATVALLRFGLTASRKVGNAVERNRARRRLRAVAEEVLPRYAASGYDYVLIARKLTLTRGFDALKADLHKALERVGACQHRPPRNGRQGNRA